MHTLTRTTLKELLASEIRDHRAQSPGECADAILALLKTYAPKSFSEDTVDINADERYTQVAEEMVRAAAFNIDTWEIRAFKPNFSDEEIQAVDDLIGQASIIVSF